MTLDFQMYYYVDNMLPLCYCMDQWVCFLSKCNDNHDHMPCVGVVD